MIGGDKRSISFDGSSSQLEEELYSGEIKDLQGLFDRAQQLGVSLQVADQREKVWQRGDVLVGEVTELSLQSLRRRRVYLTKGAYLLVEVDGSAVQVKVRGRAGWVVLGNKFAQALASDVIRRASGRPDRAAIEKVLSLAGESTPTVSPDFMVLSTNSCPPDPESVLWNAFSEDCREFGWRLCGQQ